jgi:hypothetical protein
VLDDAVQELSDQIRRVRADGLVRLRPVALHDVAFAVGHFREQQRREPHALIGQR